MGAIGRVDSVWRYPVKSMRGEQLPEIFAAFAGVWGDRLFAFKSSATPVGFPYLTGREAHEMLLYQPRFRYPEKAAKPDKLAETEDISPLLNPVAADPADLALDIETPSGELLAIDDPALLRHLAAAANNGHSLTLIRSDRAMTDCRPVSLFSLQTARQLGGESELFSTSGAFGRMCIWISGRRLASQRTHSSVTTCGLGARLWSVFSNAIRA